MFAVPMSGHRFIHRGDPASWDFATTDFTKDGQWHELDLSNIIPKNAVAVLICVATRNTASGQTVRFRKPGNNDVYNSLYYLHIHANINQTLNGMVFCASDGKIDYNLTATTWSIFNVAVRGWLV